MSNAIQTLKNRASSQANWNIETFSAVVKSIYKDASGTNVYAADILQSGQTTVLRKVANASGLRLTVGMNVSVNFAKGNRNDRKIIASGDSATSALFSPGLNVSPGSSATTAASLSGHPFLLTAPDSQVPDGYIISPGANVLVLPIPGNGVSGAMNQVVVTAAFSVVTVLPVATTTLLPDGTRLELVDSYGVSKGLYRLDAINHVWIALAGTGSSGSSAALSWAQDETLGGTVNGVNTSFTITRTPATGTFQLFVRGVRQRMSMFTQTGTTVTIVDAPQTGDDLACFYGYVGVGVITGLTSVVREVLGGAADGTNTAFTHAYAPSSGTEMIFMSGVLQNAGDDYTLSGSTAIFIVAPFAGARILSSYSHI